MTLNDNKIEDLGALWNDNRLELPQSLLKKGENNLKIGFENLYNSDMFGFQSCNDLDGLQYVYIQTVPYYAHRVTPLFDQPNLKGNFFSIFMRNF